MPAIRCWLHLVHDPQHLQCQHVLSEVVPVFDDEFDAAPHRQLTVHLLVLKLNPQRGLQGGHGNTVGGEGEKGR